MSLLNKMRGDKKGWYKVSDLVAGLEIAVPEEGPQAQPQHLHWDEIVSIKPVGREQVYDIEVEGTHNFVGNGIFAHNTYVLRANTMLAVEGEVNASTFVAPAPIASSTLMAEIPSLVLTADGKGVDLYKLSTYNLAAVNILAARVSDEDIRVTSLESRVEKLESGAIGSGSTTVNIGTGLASAMNAFGAYISKGIAQFGTLVADRFVAATNSAGTSSAGTVTILAGNIIAQVDNAYVLPSSKIFVTFTASTTGSWYISDKQVGSFKVVLSEAQHADTSFDYFLVQSEGQIATSTPEAAISKADVSVGSPTAASGQPTATTTDTGTQGSTLDTNSQGQTLNADTTPPVVTLTGAAALEINVGDLFTDPGATAIDNVDGDLTTHIIVSGTVDTATAGLYTLTYTATDAAGNHGSVSRVVTVIAAPSDGAASSTPPVPTSEVGTPTESVGADTTPAVADATTPTA